MPSNNKETRFLEIGDTEIRVADDGSKKIRGYAAKFGKWSRDLGGFREKIDKRAFNEALKDADTVALKNHDSNLLLGRTKSGTLRLSTNSTGLAFEVDMPDTTVGNDTYEEIRRGDLCGCSFAFTVTEDDWRYNEDGTVERTIMKVGDLYDVGPVTYPAYPDTSVAARSLEAFKEHLEMEEEEATPEPEPTQDAEPMPEPEQTPEEESETWERKWHFDKGYRKACRIINRCRAANAEAARKAKALDKT